MASDTPRTPFQRWLRRTVHPVYRSLETKVHPLRYLFLEITQQCNLHCLHCGSDCGRKAGRNELSFAEWTALIDGLAAHFEHKPHPVLVITGGEPLCHPKLLPLLDQMGRHRFPVGLVSNGYLLSRPTVDELVKRHLTSLTISLDGLEQSHDWLRGVVGSYKRAVAAIALCAAAPIRFFDVVTCVHPRNLAELPKLLTLLRERGVKRWRLFNIFPQGRAKANAALFLSNAEQRKMLDWIRTTRNQLTGGDFSLDLSCEGYFPKALDSALRDEPYFCRAGICIGSVLCDGAISACPNISRELIQGNVRQDDLMAVWENRYQAFRDRSWMKTGQCTECGQWQRCQGNSLHLWDFDSRRPVRCFRSLDDK